MKKNLKKLFAMLLTFSMTMSLLSVSAMAEGQEPAAPDQNVVSPLGSLAQLASKTIELTDRDTNEYEITLSVPGAESDLYNEIIIMSDNSSSQSNDNFLTLKDTIQAIGDAVLNSTGNMKLTVMSFGYRGVTALEKISTPEELAQIMETFARRDMSDGIGATNCEAGVTYVQDYISNSPNLNKAYVFYITDGEANVSDEPLVWDDWENNYLMREKKSGGYFVWNEDKTAQIPNQNRYSVAELIAMVMGYELDTFVAGGDIAPATAESFPEFAAFDQAIMDAEAVLTEAEAALATVEAEIADATAAQTAVIDPAQALKDEAAKVVADAELGVTNAETAVSEAEAALAAAKTVPAEGEGEEPAAPDQDAIDSAQAALDEAKADLVDAEAALTTAKAAQAAVDAEQDPIIAAAQAEIDAILAAIPEGEGAQSLNDKLTVAKAVVTDSEVAVAVAEAAKANCGDGIMELLDDLVLAEDGTTPLKTTEDGVEVDLTRGRQWMDLGWAQAYEMAGLSIGEPCKASEVGGAFVQYGSDSFLNAMFIQNYGYKAWFEDIHTAYNGITYFGDKADVPSKVYLRYEKGQRAATEAIALSEMEQVEKLYLIGMDSIYGTSVRTSWMNPTEENIANDTAKVFAMGPKIENQLGAGMTKICEMLEVYADQISLTPYNDVAVTDYMSKWVTLQPETIKVYDGDDVICAYNAETGAYEWADGITPPTSKDPITVELVDPSEYALGGPEVEGNMSGDIYRIHWNIKDGALLTSDDYHLRYTVTVDTAENGFEYSEYPNGLQKPGDHPFVANGTTTVEYIDINGDPQVEEIVVPMVDAPNPNPPSGGGGGGGRTPDPEPEVEIPEEPTPLSGDVEIPEEDVPLAELPDEDVPLAELPDDEVPLAMAPMTGDMSVYYNLMALVSALGLVILTLSKKREEA